MNRFLQNGMIGGTPGRQMNPIQMLQQLQQDPARTLSRMGLNVPQNLTTPNEIIQHLMNSGQVSQQAYEQARQMATRFKR